MRHPAGQTLTRRILVGADVPVRPLRAAEDVRPYQSRHIIMVGGGVLGAPKSDNDKGDVLISPERSELCEAKWLQGCAPQLNNDKERFGRPRSGRLRAPTALLRNLPSERFAFYGAFSAPTKRTRKAPTERTRQMI